MIGEASVERRPAWRTLAGPVVLGLAVLASLVYVLKNQLAARTPDKIVIRFLHWQLETGYRNAIDKAIADYEKARPDVHVVQIAIADRIYDQFLNTNLVSGSAPDLAELGRGKFADLDQYVVRFFVPLGTYIRQPNPYNRGTPLENVPWQDTFYDGMRGGYRWELQDYYRVALGLAQRRFFYNKQLYQAATGSDIPPRTFGELMEMGRQVRAYAKAHDRYVVPIVNSENRFGSYNREALGPFQVPFTSNLDDLIDTDLDGEIARGESYAAYLRGEWSLKERHLVGFLDLMLDLASLYEPGFVGMDRQTAMFRFINEQALVIYTGSWDATSIAKQCEGRFDIGVFEFPVPAPGEKYGSLVRGPETESGNVGSSGWGVFKGSAHPEVAIDFLRFLTSQPHNGPIMEIASWPPIVIGSRTTPAMKPFVMNFEGYSARLEVGLANFGNPQAVYFKELARFLQGEETLDQFASAFDAAVRDPVNGGDRIAGQDYADVRQQVRTEERLLSVQSLRMLFDPKAADAPEKYKRNLVQQIRDNVGENLRYRFEQVRHQPIPRL